MQIKRKHRLSAEVPTHSLNDIMFFLLLFFLIMAVFSNPNVIKLLTAKSSPKPPISVENKKHDLQVTVEKELFYNGTKMSNEELLNQLTAEAKTDTTMLVAIDVSPDADIQSLVDVVSICKKSNAKYYLKDPRSN